MPGRGGLALVHGRAGQRRRPVRARSLDVSSCVCVCLPVSTGSIASFGSLSHGIDRAAWVYIVSIISGAQQPPVAIC